jgi:uncharacterized protein (DUF1778 family)
MKRRISVYVTDEEHLQLRIAAACENISMTAYIARAAIEKANQSNDVKRKEGRDGRQEDTN